MQQISEQYKIPLKKPFDFRNEVLMELHGVTKTEIIKEDKNELYY